LGESSTKKRAIRAKAAALQGKVLNEANVCLHLSGGKKTSHSKPEEDVQPLPCGLKIRNSMSY